MNKLPISHHQPSSTGLSAIMRMRTAIRDRTAQEVYRSAGEAPPRLVEKLVLLVDLVPHGVEVAFARPAVAVHRRPDGEGVSICWT